MIRFFENIVNQFNEEQKCGLCWNFFAAGREDYANLIDYKDKDVCCVSFILVNFGGGNQKKIRESDGMIQREYCYNDFELVIGVPSYLDIPFYNELGEDCKENSKFVQYIEPIIECLGCGINLQCDEQGYELIEWRYELVLNYQDYNIDGILVKGRVRRDYANN